MEHRSNLDKARKAKAGNGKSKKGASGEGLHGAPGFVRRASSGAFVRRAARAGTVSYSTTNESQTWLRASRSRSANMLTITTVTKLASAGVAASTMVVAPVLPQLSQLWLVPL